MKKVMLGDRLFNRVKESAFIVFDGMSKALELFYVIYSEDARD